MAVEIGVLIRQEGVVVGLGVEVRISCVVQRDPAFLLLRPSDILDWISAPHLPFLHNPAGRHHAVGRDDGSLLQDGALEDHRVMADVHAFLARAGVERAIVLDDVVSLDQQLRAEPSGRVGSSMEDAVVANADIADQPESSKRYVTLLISPRMTVPCQMAISLRRKTSPATVALGATKMKP